MMPRPMNGPSVLRRRRFSMSTRRDFLADSTKLACGLGLAANTSSAASNLVCDDAPRGDNAMSADRFVEEHEKTVRPLEKAANLAWWVANTTGSDEAFAAKEKAQNDLDARLSNRDPFAELKAIRGAPLEDSLLKRQIDVL